MKNKLEWTDLFSGENSFNMVKIDDLPFNRGNFHSNNYQVIYTTKLKKFTWWIQVQDGDPVLDIDKRC